MDETNKPAMFNRVRAATSSYVRNAEGTAESRRYKRIRAVDPFEETKHARLSPNQSQAIAVRNALSPAAARIWWGMYVTGMGVAEFYGEWEIEGTQVHILGTKNKYRERWVPLVWDELSRPTIHSRTFTDKVLDLKVTEGWDIEAYDARRGTQTLFEDARFPGTLVDTYMGHSIKGKVGPRYGVRDLEHRAVSDRKAVRQLIAKAEQLVARGKGHVPRKLRAPKAPSEETKSPQKSPQAGISTGTKKAAKPSGT